MELFTVRLPRCLPCRSKNPGGVNPTEKRAHIPGGEQSANVVVPEPPERQGKAKGATAHMLDWGDECKKSTNPMPTEANTRAPAVAGPGFSGRAHALLVGATSKRDTTTTAGGQTRRIESDRSISWSIRSPAVWDHRIPEGSFGFGLVGERNNQSQQDHRVCTRRIKD